jgi:hypothetical protein
VRIGVTGPRDWTDVETVRQAFYDLYEDLLRPNERVTLIEGEAQGFDLVCRAVAIELNWVIEPYPKSWYDANGNFDIAAGHKRNKRMVDSGADYWIAGIMPCTKPEHASRPAHNTHGTDGCIKLVRRAGIPIRELEPYDEE